MILLIVTAIARFLVGPIGLYLLSFIPFLGIEMDSFLSAIIFGVLLAVSSFLCSLIEQLMRYLIRSVWIQLPCSIAIYYLGIWVLDHFMSSVSLPWFIILFCAVVYGGSSFLSAEMKKTPPPETPSN